MLKHIENLPRSDEKRVRLDGTSFADTLKSFATVVRRQLPIFLIILPCALTLGLLYLLTTPASYTAVARMVIDTRKVPAFQQQQTTTDTIIDTVAVATQVEILTSENVSKAVIKDLKLTEDPEFVGSGGGLIGALVHLLSSLFDSGEAVSESDLMRQALATFESRRKITRVPQTYVMSISFRSLSIPAKPLRSPMRSATPMSWINLRPNIKPRGGPAPGCKIVFKLCAATPCLASVLSSSSRRKTILSKVPES